MTFAMRALRGTSPGATLKELQARLGHASPPAAMRYQHAITERDAFLAEAMSERMLAATINPHSGAGGSPRGGRGVESRRLIRCPCSRP